MLCLIILDVVAAVKREDREREMQPAYACWEDEARQQDKGEAQKQRFFDCAKNVIISCQIIPGMSTIIKRADQRKKAHKVDQWLVRTV